MSSLRRSKLRSLTFLVDCVPLRNNWAHSAEANKHCIKLVPLFWAMTISDVIIDGKCLSDRAFVMWSNF